MFAQRLKELREENNLTQSEVAKKCNLSCQCISSLEMGTRNPTGSTIVTLADFFGVSTDYLLNRTDDLGTPLSPGNAPPLTMEDRELLALFHRLGEQRKEDVFLYMRALAGADPYTASLKSKK